MTGDSPLFDSGVVDRRLDTVAVDGYDDVWNVDASLFLVGLTVEAFTIVTPNSSDSQPARPSVRKDVMPFMRRGEGQFRSIRTNSMQNFTLLRWTIIQKGDVDFLRALVGSATAAGVGIPDHFNLLRAMTSNVPVASNGRHLRYKGMVKMTKCLKQTRCGANHDH